MNSLIGLGTSMLSAGALSAASARASGIPWFTAQPDEAISFTYASQLSNAQAASEQYHAGDISKTQLSEVVVKANSAGLSGAEMQAAKGGSRFISDGTGNILDTRMFQELQEVNVVVKGSRGATELPLFDKPGTFANLGNGHKIVYGADGRALFDISATRIKGIQWNQAPNGNWFPMKGFGTKFQGPVPQSIFNNLGL